MTGYQLERPSTAFSFTRSLRAMSKTGSAASVQRERDLNAQRDVLERMVLERDEQISSLQKSMEVQNGHVVKLQAKVEILERREKQYHTRHKAQINNMVNERNMLKAQMEVTHDEMKRIKTDPIHRALTNQEGQAKQDKSSSQRWEGKAMPAGNPFSLNGAQDKETEEEQEESIKLANHAQGILLQGQLFQAMNSLSQLRQHCHVMKENYDAIVKSLQTDLNDVSDQRARAETELLSKIDALDQDKKLMEGALMDELRSKDARIKKLEKSLKKLNRIDDDEDEDDHDDDDDDDNHNEKTLSNTSSTALSMSNEFPFGGNDKKKLVIETTGKSDFSTSSPVSVLSVTIDRDLPAFKDYATFDSNESNKSDVANMLLNAKKSQRRARELLRVTESRRRIELLEVAHNENLGGNGEDVDDALSALM